VKAGKSIIYTGVLEEVTRPDADASASDEAVLSLVVALNEKILGGGS
jgi:hypothetical protein